MIPDLQQVEAVVRQLYRSPAALTLHYHNIGHTEEVVRRAKEIAVAENLSPEDAAVVVTAAWFHDTGHLTGGIADHEARSVAIMRENLSTMGFTDEETLKKISDTIYATKFPHHPKDKLGEVICDADTYHLGTPGLLDTNKLVKKELKARGYDELTKGFRQSTLRLLETHHFFTPYINGLLSGGKAANMKWAQERATGKDGNDEKNPKSKEKGKGKSASEPRADIAPPAQPSPDPAQIAAAIGAAADTDSLPNNKAAAKQQASLQARGIQTILRLASENHLELSSLADGKANILISVNAIIISVILSVLIRRLETDTHLTVPTIIFLASSVITIVVAILATRPKLTEGSFTHEDVHAKKTNLLFFGNFYKTKLADYEWAMQRLMQDTDYIYGSLIKDIYFIGVVLGRKYKLIRLAYNVFMAGIIFSVIAFTLAVLLNKPEQHIQITNGTVPPL